MAVRPFVAVMVFAGAAALAVLLAAEASPAPAVPPAAAVPLHPVAVRAPAGPPRALTRSVGHQGVPATIACSTCHSTRPPNPSNRATADLDLFHQGLQVAHGNAGGNGQTVGSNACLTCHNPQDYDSLRLADGQRVEFPEVMRLCAQCHGPQFRDWTHGAHGGMNGYWDLRRGGRVRNNCIDCHDPHVPKYQPVLPMPPPRDRFQGAHP